jgi:hypothetical protein
VDDVDRRAVVVAEAVRVVQPAQRVGDDAEPDRGAERPRPRAPEQLLERQPLDVLHRQEGHPLLLADLVGVHDVGVVEPQRQPRLVEERAEPGVALGQPRLGALEHDQLVDPQRAERRGEVDVGLAAAAELGEQLVAPEAPQAVTRGQRHEFGYVVRCRHRQSPREDGHGNATPASRQRHDLGNAAAASPMTHRAPEEERHA